MSEITLLHGDDSTVRSVSFDPTSGLLASGADDQTVRLWSLENRQAPQAIGGSLAPPGTRPMAGGLRPAWTAQHRRRE